MEIDQERISAELSELEKRAGEHTLGQITSGDWFEGMLKASLGEYIKEVTPSSLREAYPDLTPAEVASRRMADAKRISALAGQVSSDAYGPGVAGALKSGDMKAAVPAGTLRFVADLFHITRLQLRLAHDLCAIHEQEMGIDEDADVLDLTRIAFGLRAGELLAESRSLAAVGQHLLRRNGIKFSIPVVSVPLNAALDYYFTGSMARMANEVLSARAGRRMDIIPEEVASPKVLLESIWLTIVADEEIAPVESIFINNLVAKLFEIEGGEETIEVLKQMENIGADEVLARISTESDEVKKTLYEVVCDAAAIDHKIHRKERKLLKRFAETCGTRFDVKDLKLRAKRKK